MKRLVYALVALFIAFSVRAAVAVDTVSSEGTNISNELNWGGLAYTEQVENGDSGAAVEIDWTAGNNQCVTLTDDAVITFVDPPSAAHVTLCMIQDGSGGHSPTWPTNVEWPEDVEPTWNTDPNKVNIFSAYFNGTGYFGAGSVGYDIPVRSVSYSPDTGQVGTAADGVVGVATSSAGFAALLATTPNLVADEMSGIGGPANTIQVVLQSSSTTDEFSATVAGITCFDTDDGRISHEPTGATLTLYATGSANPLGGDFDIHIVAATPADPGTFVAADFTTLDSVSLDSIAFGSINTSGANVFTIPPESIDTEGKTCFGIVYGDLNTGTFSGSWLSSEISLVTFESTEGTNPPVLTVTH